MMRSRIFRVDPDVVMVAVVRPLDAQERLAAVDAFEQRHLRTPEDVGVVRVDGQRRVITGPLADAAIAMHQLPRLAAVVAAEQAALVRLDEGIDAPAVRRGDGHADLAPDAFGQPLAVFLALGCVLAEPQRFRPWRRHELRPGVAAVARGVQPAAGPAAGQLPRPPPRLPQPGEQHFRIGRIEAHIGGAGVGVLEQDALPGLAAVGGAVDAALGIGTEGMAQHRGIGDVGVRRMDDHGADLPFLLPDVLPRLAGVGGFVDAVADLDVAADVGLAGAGVDHVRIGRRDRQRADGGSRLLVEDRLPVNAAVAGLPQAAGGGGGVVGERIARHAGDSADAAAGGGADRAKLETLELGRAALGFLRAGRPEGEQGEENCQDATGLVRVHKAPISSEPEA